MSSQKRYGTVVANDGLRYKHKASGSPFPVTMSCFRCGKHRMRSALETKIILGKNHLVCKGGCCHPPRAE